MEKKTKDKNNVSSLQERRDIRKDLDAKIAKFKHTRAEMSET